MSAFAQETDFFHEIAHKVRELANSFSDDISITKHKGIDNYATEVDVAVEDLIVKEITKKFPGDAVLAEEAYADTTIPIKRIWIIDPICGTSNLGRGIKNYCTNIALADNGQLVASCVVDHSQNNYFWSVGQNTLYINKDLRYPVRDDLGITIDVDLGSLKDLDEKESQKLINCLQHLTNETNYALVSLNSSLGFAYTAIGKLDGFINSYCHPWDICASSFLIQQSGGIISNLDGKPWTILSNGAIAARNKAVHDKLLSYYLNS